MPRRYIVLLGTLVFVASLTLLARERLRRSAEPPHIVIILIDTLRSDHLGAWGNRRGMTPFLDRLAARGARFANTYAASSWTVPSIASLFTSRYPGQHHVTTGKTKLVDSEVTLAEMLSARGYASAGFSANYFISEPFGYRQGFESWRTDLAPSEGAKIRGEVLRTNSMRWLDGRPDRTSARPLFLYYQFMEPHAPYEPPEPYRSRFARPHAPGEDTQANQALVRGDFWDKTPDEVALLASLYDGEVAAVDEEVHRLYVGLEQRGLLDNTVLVITSDHGEEFGEHGALGHGYTLYNEQLKVPLIIVGSGIPVRQIDEPVSLVDLAPTLLELAGASVPPSFEGRSLVPLLVDRTAPRTAPVDVVAELESLDPGIDLRTHDAAIVRVSMKLLHSINVHVKPQIFDLSKDPGERSPNPPELLREREVLVAAMVERQLALRDRSEPTRESVTLDEAKREQLRALGYH